MKDSRDCSKHYNVPMELLVGALFTNSMYGARSCGNYFWGETLHHYWLSSEMGYRMSHVFKCLNVAVTCWDFSPCCGGIDLPLTSAESNLNIVSYGLLTVNY